ncbi:unnamed protein product [Allacma fusca]|uniref:Uncharacterized protein n=1 Tax=Allacma fusca TaxID=39272 RepID=A0A8J2LII2_9HEXA|nr:unnamed protein product [Allacma fusca]
MKLTLMLSVFLVFLCLPNAESDVIATKITPEQAEELKVLEPKLARELKKLPPEELEKIKAQSPPGNVERLLARFAFIH